MTRFYKAPSHTLTNRRKYVAICSFLRGSSITANPKRLVPGDIEAFKDLEQKGICFLDKRDIAPAEGKVEKEAPIDPGDAMGRYRMVNGKQGLAQAMTEQLER